MQAPLTRWAGSFVAYDCLSAHMKVPYEEKYPLGDILTGQVTCSGGHTLLGRIIAAPLISTHIFLLLAPVYLTTRLLSARPRLEGHIRSFDTIIISMFAFVLASVGEIGQHCFDNWLYLDSRVSFFNFVFYLLTTASNAILASGLGSSPLETGLAVAACIATPFSFVLEGLVRHKPYMSTASQIPIWIGMFVTVLLFLYRAWQLQVPRGQRDKLLYTALILATYVFGVFAGQKIVTTGYQAWHLLTASSFCAGFLIEGFWLLRAYTFPKESAKLL